MDRKKKRSDWAKRYDERNPRSAYEGQEVEDGQIPDRQPSTQESTQPPEFWREEDETYYRGNRESRGHGDSSISLHSENSGGGRWTYPANFDDAVLEGSSRRKKKSTKKDRWERTEEAYAATDDSTVRRKKKKSKKARSGDTQPSAEYYRQRDTLDTRYDPDVPTHSSSNGHANASKVASGEQSEFDHQF